MTATRLEGRLGSGGTEEKGLVDMDKCGDCREDRNIKGLYCNGKIQ